MCPEQPSRTGSAAAGLPLLPALPAEATAPQPSGEARRLTHGQGLQQRALPMAPALTGPLPAAPWCPQLRWEPGSGQRHLHSQTGGFSHARSQSPLPSVPRFPSFQGFPKVT